MERIANSKARGYVASRKPFIGSNLFGKWSCPTNAEDMERDCVYVVYSYGTHFPLWVWDGNVKQWFGNHDRYSKTTTKHRGQTQPVEGSSIRWFDTETMKQLVYRGLSGIAADRVLTGRRMG